MGIFFFVLFKLLELRSKIESCAKACHLKKKLYKLHGQHVKFVSLISHRVYKSQEITTQTSSKIIHVCYLQYN